MRRDNCYKVGHGDVKGWLDNWVQAWQRGFCGILSTHLPGCMDYGWRDAWLVDCIYTLPGGIGVGLEIRNECMDYKVEIKRCQ